MRDKERERKNHIDMILPTVKLHTLQGYCTKQLQQIRKSTCKLVTLLLDLGRRPTCWAELTGIPLGCEKRHVLLTSYLETLAYWHNPNPIVAKQSPLPPLVCESHASAVCRGTLSRLEAPSPIDTIQNLNSIQSLSSLNFSNSNSKTSSHGNAIGTNQRNLKAQYAALPKPRSLPDPLFRAKCIQPPHASPDFSGCAPKPIETACNNSLLQAHDKSLQAFQNMSIC